MITRHTLSTAARNADAYAQQHGLMAWLRANETDIEGLSHVAEQRALRAAALLLDGVSPTQFELGGFKLIHLTPQAARLMPVLMACFMDGYCVGRTAKHEA